MKPLLRKAYGSIPHLPESRVGAGDHHCSDGEAAICTIKPRDRHDRIIVTEKLDGCCCAVANVEGRILALSRSGYMADESGYEHHRIFAQWVRSERERFSALLAVGERAVGEWLALAHGTRYDLPHEPFVVFDLMIEAQRAPWEELQRRAVKQFFMTPRVLSDGPPFSTAAALRSIAESGHGALDPVEGAVWRVERRGAFNLMAKWVRHDKVDGVYLPEISGGAPIWNWRP